jgi:hypothetical protein
MDARALVTALNPIAEPGRLIAQQLQRGNPQAPQRPLPDRIKQRLRIVLAAVAISFQHAHNRAHSVGHIDDLLDQLVQRSSLDLQVIGLRVGPAKGLEQRRVRLIVRCNGAVVAIDATVGLRSAARHLHFPSVKGRLCISIGASNPEMGYSKSGFNVGRVIRASTTSAYENLRRLLTQARLDAELTQAQVATRLNRPQSFVSKYESGERQLDVIEFLAICRAIGVEPAPIIESLT